MDNKEQLHKKDWPKHIPKPSDEDIQFLGELAKAYADERDMDSALFDDMYGSVPKEDENEVTNTPQKYLTNLDHNVEEMKSSLQDTENLIAQMFNSFISDLRSRERIEFNDIFPAIHADIASIRRWVIAMVFSSAGAALIAIITMLVAAYQALR